MKKVIIPCCISEPAPNQTDAKARAYSSITKCGKKYGKIISKYSKLYKLDDDLIYAIIGQENPACDTKHIGKYGEVGLMQIRWDAGLTFLFHAQRRGILSKEIYRTLGKYGVNISHLKKMKYDGQYRDIINKAHLKYPEVNILVGTIGLRLLCDEHIEEMVDIKGNKVVGCNLAKVIIRWNITYYFSKNYFDLNQYDGYHIKELIDRIGQRWKTTKNYILSVWGRGGILENVYRYKNKPI